MAMASMRSLEQAVNEMVLTANKDDGGERDRDRDSLAESLALSDVAGGMCNSFTSLDTLLDLDQGGATAQAADPTGNIDSDSRQNLTASASPQPESTKEHNSEVPVFRRQRWETKSMTSVERAGADKPSFSVGGWSENTPTAASSAGPVHKGSFVRKRDLWEKRASVTSQPAGPTITTTAPAPATSAPAPVTTGQPILQQQQRQKHTPDLVMDLPPSLPLSSSPKESEILANASAPTDKARERHESGSSSGSASSSSPGSPDMTTAAETFAMQNQSTLKKSNIKQVKKVVEPAEPTSQISSEQGACSSRPVAAGSSIKVSVSPYGSSPSTTTTLLASASSAPRPAVTPKLVTRFPHQYGTPCPVLPVAFAAEAAASPGDPSRPQVRIKPQVLKKPTLPTSLNSPETARRSSGLDHHNSQV